MQQCRSERHYIVGSVGDHQIGGEPLRLDRGRHDDGVRPGLRRLAPVTATRNIAAMPLEFQVKDRVAVLTLDDGRANAIGLGTLGELGEALDRIDADPDVRAVLIVGRAGRFSAGFDLAAMTAGPESMRELVIAGARFIGRLLLEPRPVVAACTGHALAAGAFLLLASDHRIGAAGDWKIGLNEVAIGMAMPKWGVELGRYRLSPTEFEWRLGLGQTATPEEAVVAGFLDRIVAPEDVVDEAMGAATRLAELRTGAVGGTKERARRALVDRMLDGLEEDLASITVPRPG
jgi:enoyl-CoA hydratase